MLGLPIVGSLDAFDADEPEAGPSLQPFECLVCNRRFTRHENLKRHAVLHRAPKDTATIQCAYCTSTFARRDLRRRHVKRKHPQEKGSDDEFEPRQGESQGSAVGAKPPEEGGEGLGGGHGQSGSDGISMLGDGMAHSETASGSVLLTAPAVDSAPLLSGGSSTSPLRFDFNVDNGLAPWSPIDIDGFMRDLTEGSISSGTSQVNLPPMFAPESLSPPMPLMGSLNRSARLSSSTDLYSPDRIRTGTALFFDNTAHYFNFVHRSTFVASEVPQPLLLGIMAIGLQFSRDSAERQLASEYYYRGKAILADEAAWKEDLSSSIRLLGIIQALVLLSNHSIMYIGGDETQHGFRLHTKSVELARKAGLMEPYPSQPANTTGLGDLWRNAIRIESHKRTLFAIYQYDAIWYCALSRPRSLSHLEIKHDLPLPDDFWLASTAEDWAHRTLLHSHRSNSPTRYIDAVRSSLSSSDVSPFLALDSLGMLLVIMFHFTSIREISGWSTMSGRPSFERFEAIHSSLSSMKGCCRPSRKGEDDTMIALACQATWHICMIELSLWSQPHTGGLVEGSLDAALAAATRLVAAHPVPIAPEIAESLEAHITWMIDYLHRTTDTTMEPPWMTVYLFKAALIALQVFAMGICTSVQRLGVQSTGQMLMWMREIFGRRNKWAIGRLITRSLDELEASVT